MVMDTEEKFGDSASEPVRANSKWKDSTPVLDVLKGLFPGISVEELTRVSEALKSSWILDYGGLSRALEVTLEKTLGNAGLASNLFLALHPTSKPH